MEEVGRGLADHPRVFAVADEWWGCITAPTNEASIAFHRALGFSARLSAEHEGPGADKIIFRAWL